MFYSNPQPHPQLFFFKHGDCGARCESYLEGFMYQVVCAKLLEFRKNQRKTYLYIRKVVTKTI